MKQKRTFAILAVLLVMGLSACQPQAMSPTPVLTNTPLAPTNTPSATIPAASSTPTPIPTPTLAPESEFIKGVWFVDWGLGPGVDTSDGKQALTDNIIPLGANWISLTVSCQMHAADPSRIVCNADDSLSDEAIVRTVETAHSLGLRVALFSSALDVSGVPDNWSANLDYGSDQQAWSAYFESYAGQLLHYAEVAEENGIDLLIIGGEQTGTQKQEDHWRTMIDQVRKVYHGPITYDAWCQHFDSVNWWDAVDYIGVNFYCHPLAGSQDPTYEEVKNNYLKYIELVKMGTSKWEKQVIFTEIGYESVNGVAQIVPFGLQPVHLDVGEQGILVRAFFDALRDDGNQDQWLKGLFWYNFTSSPLLGGMGDINFTPHNKPAEVYIQAYYKNQEAVSTPSLPGQADENRIKTSYWIFSDKLENQTVFGPWAGNEKPSVIDDPLQERGAVIQVNSQNHWDGIQLAIPETIDLRDYDFLELYLYAPKYEPNLELHFNDSAGQEIRDWVYIRSFIDHEPLLDGQWHRISIPLQMLYPEDHPEKISKISSIYLLHMWPGQPGPITYYIDDVRLIALDE